jgi:hypothetical protein
MSTASRVSSCLDVRRHGDVVVVRGDVGVGTSRAKWATSSRAANRVEDSAGGPRELVLVADARELGRRVDEQHRVVGLRLLQHDDARGDRGAEEEVRRELDHGVHVVVVDEVLADLLLGPPR